MKHTKKLISMMLALLVVISMIPAVAAANSKVIFDGLVNYSFVEQSSFKYVEWGAVTGADYYRITVVYNNDTNTVLTPSRNYPVYDTRYNISSIIKSVDIPSTLKIYVDAIDSSGNVVYNSGNSVLVTVIETPVITCGSAGSVTTNSAKLSVTINKNYGSPIKSAGFYVGTSTNVSAAKAYSVSSVSSSGTMTKTISGLQPGTTYYYWAYAENSVGETISSRKSFTTEKGSATLSLSTENVSLTYNTTRATVTVTASGSWSVSDPEYNVSSSAVKGYDYEWLVVSTSGDKLYLTPKRPNWSESSRSAEVTVTCGNQSKTVTVTQAKCGIAAPTVTVKYGNKVLYDGDDIETFTTGQSIVEVSVASSNVGQLSASLRPGTGGYALDTSKNEVSFDISDLPAGKYMIEIYASNSYTANDYWSQSAFANGSMKLYFTIVGSGSSSEGGTTDGAIGAAALGEDMAKMALSLVGTYKGTLGYAGNWCAPFVAYCADKAGVSGQNKPFLATANGKANRSHANPFCLLNPGEAKVYSFYKDSDWPSWESENCYDEKTVEFFMKDFSPVYLSDRSACEPVKGDLVFFKSSSGNPWAHVGIVVDYNRSTKKITFVDGNNSGNGTWIDGKEATDSAGSNPYNKADHRYVNKLTISLTNSAIRAIAHPYYSTEAITYKVTFDPNDWANGTPKAESTQIKSGETITIRDIWVDNGGKEFLGWAFDSDFNKVVYKPGDKYTVKGPICFYAVWGDVKEETPAYIPGDINLDGDVDIHDAVELIKYSMFPGLFPLKYKGNVDYNHDGSVTIGDAVELIKYSMFPGLFPIE